MRIIKIFLGIFRTKNSKRIDVEKGGLDLSNNFKIKKV